MLLHFPAIESYLYCLCPGPPNSSGSTRLTHASRSSSSRYILSKLAAKEDEILGAFPADYAEEIRGISAAIKMDLPSLILCKSYSQAQELAR